VALDSFQGRKCEFYEVPYPTYSSNEFPTKTFDISNDDVNTYLGTLEVNLSEADTHIGTFKMVHPGHIQIMNGSGLFSNEKVCVKQVFDRRPQGGIACLKGRHELKRLSVECNCLIWASILLDLTYNFVNCKIERMRESGCLIPVVPALRFMRSMIALI
jgi:hypothetical protein